MQGEKREVEMSRGKREVQEKTEKTRQWEKKKDEKPGREIGEGEGSCKERNERQIWGKKKKSREREAEVGKERKSRNKEKNGNG